MKQILGVIVTLAALFAINAFANHGEYLTNDSSRLEMQQQIVGVGIVLEKIDSILLIKDVVKDGSAYRDGRIQQGDLVVAVNETLQPGDGYISTANMTLVDVVSIIRGKIGTRVGLLIERGDQTLSFILKR
ncbi:MAG: PDZ domain-containing protein [Bdellovibrionaceae bacterium]|nr:PDZ domain-containing protein [Pseudobdellovibrionaceae bacterium]